VDRWLASPQRNYGLLVEVRTVRSLKPAPHHHVRLRRSADEAHERWQHKQPLLFTYTDDGRHKARSIRDVSGGEVQIVKSTIDFRTTIGFGCTST